MGWPGGSACIHTIAKRSTESSQGRCYDGKKKLPGRKLTHNSEPHGVLERGSRHRRVDRSAGDLHAVVGPLRTVLYHAGRHRGKVLLTDLKGRMERWN